MGVYRRGSTYYIDFYHEGRRVRERIGPSKKQAEQALAVRQAEVLQGRFKLKTRTQSPKFSEFASDYVKYAKSNKRSWSRDELSLKHLTAAFGEKRLGEITPWLVEHYKAERAKDVRPATVNLELACLKHLFTLALTWGKADANPVKQVRLLRVRNQVERILTPEEEARLLEVASERLRPVVQIALNTGMRLGEIAVLRWEEIDEVRTAIRVRQSKGGKSRSIPMNRTVVDVLTGLRPNEADSGPVFGVVANPGQFLRADFVRARKKAELTDVRFHDLRHTFATRLVTAGVDIVTVSRLLGHATIHMTIRYAHPAPDDLRRAVQALEGTLVKSIVSSEKKQSHR